MMGVTASGKTTVGRALAARLGWPFADADDYHLPASIAKMHAGIPLTDADRAPWLASLRGLIARAIDRREHLVLACSALKQSYRDVLGGGLHPVRFVYLKADEAALRARLEHRSDHFAGTNLLVSQFAALEEPHDALSIDATAPLDWILDTIRYECGL